MHEWHFRRHFHAKSRVACNLRVILTAAGALPEEQRGVGENPGGGAGKDCSLCCVSSQHINHRQQLRQSRETASQHKT